MKRTLTSAVLTTLLAAPLVSGTAFAQDYPTRSIRMVVPFAPGGGTDFSARTIAQSMTDSFGQTVSVDNKPGAATNIGAEIVAKAAPDGYTLLLSSGSTFAMNPAISKKTPYDTFRDFTPVGSFSRYVLLLVVAPDVPVKSVQEFITYAKARPGQLSFGSPGLNSSHQLAMELFMQRTGLTMIHVPFKGAAPAMQEIIAGRVNSMFQDLATALQQIKAGKLRALGVASDKRFPSMPEVPTVSEAGVAGFDASAWIGIVAPTGTPVAIINKLNAEMNKVLANPGLLQKLADTGAEPLPGTPAQFGALLRREADKWAEVIKKAKLAEE